jgi:hypothetical protein
MIIRNQGLFRIDTNLMYATYDTTAHISALHMIICFLPNEQPSELCARTLDKSSHRFRARVIPNTKLQACNCLK